MTPSFTQINLRLEAGIAYVELFRPEKANAMTEVMFTEIGQAFAWADETAEVRVVLLSGAGRHFCAGLDHSVLAAIRPQGLGRAVEVLRRRILQMQDCVTQIEACRKPVIAAIHGACIGGGLDVAVACDIRLMTEDARLSLKEVDLGIIADVGVLQRLPHIVGEGRARDMAFTAREVSGTEAYRIGLADYLTKDAQALTHEALRLAEDLAAKSPLALQGTKQVMTRRLSASIREGLDHVATWNAGVMFSEDLEEALAAFQDRRQSRFDNL